MSKIAQLRAVYSATGFFKAREAESDKQESLALASMARDDPPTSSTAMRGKVGSEFET